MNRVGRCGRVGLALVRRAGVLLAGVVMLTAGTGCRWPGSHQSGVSGTEAAPAAGAPVRVYVGDPGAVLVSQRITFEVKGVQLQEVVEQLSRAGNVEIVQEEKLDRERYETPVTLKLRGVTLGSALHWVTGAGELTYCVDGSRVMITEEARLSEEQRAGMMRFQNQLERAWRPGLEKRLTEDKVSCDVEGVGVEEFFDFIAEAYGVNCVTALETTVRPRPLRLKMKDVTLAEVFDAIGKEYGAQWVPENEVVVFRSRR